MFAAQAAGRHNIARDENSKKMGAVESAQNYQRRRLKTPGWLPPSAFIVLHSNPDASFQTT
jgi:hypothetical protein